MKQEKHKWSKKRRLYVFPKKKDKDKFHYYIEYRKCKLCGVMDKNE